MNDLEPLMRYAAAFEDSFASNDWSTVGAHLAEDVVWIVSGAPRPFGGVFEGRSPVLAAIERSCDAFDRRFDRRKPKLAEGPTLIPGGVHFTWFLTFSREDLPTFELRGEEWDFFRDGKLELHRERLWNVAEALDYLTSHGAKLRPER